MKEIFIILICIFITILLSPYIFICIAIGLKNHFKAKDMTLKQRIKKFINEEFNPVIA